MANFISQAFIPLNDYIIVIMKLIYNHNYEILNSYFLSHKYL